MEIEQSLMSIQLNFVPQLISAYPDQMLKISRTENVFKGGHEDILYVITKGQINKVSLESKKPNVENPEVIETAEIFSIRPEEEGLF